MLPEHAYYTRLTEKRIEIMLAKKKEKRVPNSLLSLPNDIREALEVMKTEERLEKWTDAGKKAMRVGLEELGYLKP